MPQPQIKRPDLFDYIGIALALFIVALVAAHFILPPGPPPTELSS